MALEEDAFETVAITWSQPEAAVMLSMFEFYGIPAFALGRLHASVTPPWIVALQGIQIRVHAAALDEALDILGEVAERPAAIRPPLFKTSWIYRTFVWLAAAMYFWAMARGLAGESISGDDSQYIVLMALTLPGAMLMIAAPPPRTPSTFMLWKRSRPATAND